jgi:hypothetical protein
MYFEECGEPLLQLGVLEMEGHVVRDNCVFIIARDDVAGLARHNPLGRRSPNA